MMWGLPRQQLIQLEKTAGPKGPVEGVELLGQGSTRRVEGSGPEGEKMGSEGGSPPRPWVLHPAEGL